MTEKHTMRYIDVNWHHDSDTDPYRVVSEMNSENYEIRKIEFFRDGSIGHATELYETPTTALGTVVVPS